MSATNTTQNFTINNEIVSSVSAFTEDWHVRVTWIAFMTLWVFWGLIWIVRSYFIGQEDAATTTPATETEASQKKFGVASSSFASRLTKGHQIVKDALFSLLCLLSMNTFARASTRAVMILAWFFVAFAVIWFVAELIIDNRYLRVVYTTIFYALGLAIAGLAYKQGFY
jgi:hypothetical protein